MFYSVLASWQAGKLIGAFQSDATDQLKHWTCPPNKNVLFNASISDQFSFYKSLQSLLSTIANRTFIV